MSRYLAAISFVALAAMLTTFLWAQVQPAVALFFTAVMLSAWYGGIGPGLLASVLSAIVTEWLSRATSQPADFGWRGLLRLAVFLTCAVLISYLSSSLRRTERTLLETQEDLERRVHERTAELTAANQQMQEEIAVRWRAERAIRAQQEELRQLTSELAKAEERQLRQVAAELHDGIGQLLATAEIRLDLLLAQVVPAGAPPGEPAGGLAGASRGGDEAELDRIRDLIEEAIQRTRSLTVELSPPVLYELGFEPAIRWLAAQVRERHGIEVAVEADGRVPVDEELRTFLFRTVRELLANMAKHSGARRGKVIVGGEDGRVKLRVEDDGVGMDLSASDALGPHARARRNSFGLFDVRERLKHYGGRLEVEARPGEGCRFTVVVPTGHGDGVVRGGNGGQQRSERESGRFGEAGGDAGPDGR